MVFRVYVEKKPGFDVEAQQLGTELKTILGIDGLRKVRIVNRYDVEGISQELFEQATPTVFSEPQVDDASADLPDFGDATVFATEFLPGQFDQRADSAAECIQLISQGERPTVRSAKVYALEGTLSEADVAAIKHYVINPVEAREASLEAKTTLKTQVPTPARSRPSPASTRWTPLPARSSSTSADSPWIWPILSSARSTSPKRDASPRSPRSR